MTTAKRLHLMLAITVMFGFLAMFSIVQLSKVIKFQHLNYLYLKNVSELSDVLTKYPETPLVTSDIIQMLGNIREQPAECNTMMNGIDKHILRMIGADTAISLCENDIIMITELIGALKQYRAPMIVDTILIDSLGFATKAFNLNSKRLEEPVDKIGRYTIQFVSWIVIPFSIFVILISIFIFRKIRIKTMQLHDAISALENSEEEKKQLAYYDTLTSLPNRNLFTEILEHEIHQVKRYGSSFALLYIDLDRFKFINDTLGHDAGDDLIVQVSKRLNKYTRDSDTLARFGGDEFLLIISGPNSEKHATTVAEKIIKQIAMPFTLDEHEMYISASVGIAYCPGNGLDSTTLLKRSDIAMYEAKANGKNRYHAYEEHSINHKTEHRLIIEKDLRRCIEGDELFLHYQPIVNLNNRNTIGAEALLRWKHNTKGMISPVEFIPIAEETGMILEIGEWAINEACKQCKVWRETGRSGFHVAVNVSAHQLKNDKLPIFINDTLRHYDLPAEALDIEITESVFYGEDSKSRDNLNQLKEIGVRLLLDDFGTGYSSLSTLHGLPFSTIKIDRAFMDIHHPRKRVMTQTIIDMAKNFGMQTIAEGVEDQDAVDFLRGLGCEFAQGYFFQRPVTAMELDITRNYSQTQIESNITAING